MQGCLAALAKLKQSSPAQDLKIILSVGGGGKGSEGFVGAAGSELSRQTFARRARETVDRYGFDGIDST